MAAPPLPAPPPADSHRLGLKAEALCRLALALKGWHLLGRRVRTGLGEIDLIARRGSIIAIIEVKARPTLAQAAEAIQPRQQARLARAAAAWLARHPRWQALSLRFDAMLVTPGAWPRHIEDAWRP